MEWCFLDVTRGSSFKHFPPGLWKLYARKTFNKYSFKDLGYGWCTLYGTSKVRVLFMATAFMRQKVPVLQATSNNTC